MIQQLMKETLLQKNLKVLFHTQAVVGGDTGIDIYRRPTRAQILEDFHVKNDFIYFGDKMDYLGNDYFLKMKLLTNKLL